MLDPAKRSRKSRKNNCGVGGNSPPELNIQSALLGLNEILSKLVLPVVLTFALKVDRIVTILWMEVFRRIRSSVEMYAVGTQLKC